MSSTLLAFLFAVGVGGWVYSKTDHRTGGNTKTNIIVTGLVGIIAFFVSWSLFSMIMD